ncbi:two-component system sensor histidine kinase YesM [Paenibacillus castaneae]|uniref:cache domain-containing sensor histidine kinase n=1 Tax=Paenibacillus castaneae TaxID=474957 RepID=UPI000C9BBCD6|nr:sensor histidine kinase [Paenibacillus castaneae]NIK79909.1 two-component system sensor histidine kinase YesM [Paenibacillus castaneae]
MVMKWLQKWFQLNNWTIRYKLIFHFLLISILPASAIALLMGLTVNGIMEKQVNEHTLQLIGNVNKSLNSYAGNIQNISYFISMNQDVQAFLKKGDAAIKGEHEQYRLSKFMQSFTALNSEVAGIIVVDDNGQYFSNDMYARSERSLTEESWYREAVQAKGIFKMIGHPSNRNVTTHANYKDSEVVSVVRAIQDPDTQKTQGVVLIDLKLRVIAETVRDVRLGKTGYLMVINDDGESIYAPRNSKVGSIDMELLGRQSSGTFSQTVDGRELQFIFQKSPFTNWTTVGVFDVQDSVQGIKDFNLYLVIFIFVVCTLGIAASYFLSHSISRPISQLSSFMRKVEDGNMHIRIPEQRVDEVGMLGRSFNKMLSQMTLLIAQVWEEQQLKREAELRSLQAHIQPHFLYNTLDTIQWLARKDGAQEAAEVVEALSKLFRIGLSKGHEMIPIHDEFEHIRSYLKIQKTRYKDKLNYSIQVDESCGDALVLKLILQPVVENAIYHGIKERRGPGMIAIRAGLNVDTVEIVIEDDGVGMPEERLASLRAVLASVPAAAAASAGESEASGLEQTAAAAGGQNASYGLRNVQERIRLSFGEPYGLEIESVQKRGTTVTIKHPIIRRKGGDLHAAHLESVDRG